MRNSDDHNLMPTCFGPRQLLAYSLWMGLLTGYLELFNLGVRTWVFGKVILFGPHTLWLAPLGDGLIFSVTGLALLPLTLFRSQKRRVGSCAFVLVTGAGLSLILLHPVIHTYAALLLAAAIGFQAARLVSTYQAAFFRLVRGTLPVLLGLWLILAIGIPVWRYVTEKRMVAQLPQSHKHAPNLLIIVWDTVRAKSLSTYGYERQTTPQLTNLAEQGVTFDLAFATSPWTLPTHGSLFTGRWAHELSTGWEVPLDRKYPTLAEVLRSYGYTSAGFIANQYYCSWEYGLNRGFIHYEDFSNMPVELVLSCQLGRTLATSHKVRKLFHCKNFLGRKSAEEINRDFLRWLDHNSHRPFFVFLNYFDAHDPYLPPPPFDVKFGRGLARDYLRTYVEHRKAETVNRANMSTEDVLAERDAYDGAIAYLDQQLGLLLNGLRRRGLIEDTLIIVTSDHGEHHGEHGVTTHGNSLYRPLLHVPLVLHWPEQLPSGSRVSQPVSVRDVPATVMQLFFEGGDTSFPGAPLSRFWHPETEASAATGDPILATLEPRPDRLEKADRAVGAVITSGLHLIKFRDGHEQCFDVANDPEEEHDLVKQGGDQGILRDLRSTMKSQLGRYVERHSVERSLNQGPRNGL